MLSVIIPTDESERALVPTLAALVPGATAGAIREVIVADKGSQDQTAEGAGIAGCRRPGPPPPPAGPLRAAAAGRAGGWGGGAGVAGGPWLMFLRPGIAPDPSWIPETLRFIEAAELSGKPEGQTAVFSPGPVRSRPLIAALRARLSRQPRP